MTFAEWLKAVDTYLLSVAGITHMDLSDGASNDRWTSGVTPENYAKELLESDGFPMELLDE